MILLDYQASIILWPSWFLAAAMVAERGGVQAAMTKLMHCLPSDRACWNHLQHGSRCNHNNAQLVRVGTHVAQP